MCVFVICYYQKKTFHTRHIHTHKFQMSLAAINKHFQEEEKKRKQIPMGMSSTLSSSSMLIILKSEKKTKKSHIRLVS